MSEISKYEDQKKKLAGLCEEHNLTYRFRRDTYPITLTIKPLSGVYAQMSMLAEADSGNYISPDASMTWSFAEGELTSRVSGGTFTISKTLRTKFENILLKMIGFWQQYFFRDVIEKGSLRKGMMPVIDEADANDYEEEEQDLADAAQDEESAADGDGEDGEVDPDEDLITAATLLVRQENKASVSLLQRRLKIGYAKASRLMDRLEELDVVGPFNGSELREVLPSDVPEDEEGSDNA